MIMILILILCLGANIYIGIYNKDIGNYRTSNFNWFTAGFITAAIIVNILSIVS